jgi:hypothetical protein
METTKGRSPNIIWRFRCLDDYIRMNTEFSMFVTPFLVDLMKHFHLSLSLSMIVAIYRGGGPMWPSPYLSSMGKT